MMITAYQVSYQEFEGDRFYFPLYLNSMSACLHQQKLKDLNADDAQVNPVEIDSLPRQRVTIYGNHAGYQFSRTTMGKRTFKLKVRNIRRVSDDKVIGQVHWNGRVLPVIYRFSDAWETVK